jgi:hypothetical protein
MSFRIIHPVAMPIDGSNFSEAVKNYIKLNRFMNIEQIILSDQYNHMKANVRYYNDNNRRKASIQLMPINPAAIPSIIGFRSNDPNARYPGGFVVGPSSIGGPAGIVAPAPVMVGGPLVVGPPGPAISGMIFGARPPAAPASGAPASGAPASGASSPAAPSVQPVVATPGIFGPTAVLTRSNQILPIRPINPINPIGVDGKPITGLPVPFGVGVGVAQPIRFGMGVL